MKISKLFHWLYAIVMLLPIFAIGVTCAYVIFNKNANQSYSSNQIKEQNIIGANDELQEGITYNFVYNGLTTFDYNSGYIYVLDGQTNIKDNLFPNESWIVDRFSLTYEQNRARLIIYDTDNIQHNIFNYWETYNQNLYFVNKTNVTLSNYGTPYFTMWFNTYNEEKLDNIFYYSIDKVTESAYFSWAYDSFLVSPFTYIVNLFGMPIDSPIVMLLSYWLDISIIWLVFDLIMYVPLLVHRWLDKGVLE